MILLLGATKNKRLTENYKSEVLIMYFSKLCWFLMKSYIQAVWGKMGNYDCKVKGHDYIQA
jgi:hypothetical protein